MNQKHCLLFATTVLICAPVRAAEIAARWTFDLEFGMIPTGSGVTDT